MSKKKPKGNLANNSWLNFLDTLTSIVIIPVLAISIICSVIMMNAKKSNNVPNIFGFSLVTVLSESMTKSGFEIDETVMVKVTDPDEIQVGDIIAYYKYIETTNADLSEIARAQAQAKALAHAQAHAQGKDEEDTTTANAYDGASEAPIVSRVASWKLTVSKLFSNFTYTASEASDKAIKARSAIIFHQVVEVVEYDGYKWFRTWGSSNVDARGNPIYDNYWIREDYVIGRYTHTSSAVRSFLSFASTNTGILWMVEVPSGIHLVLSTLELVEILDMMTKERHERIKNGTYIDKREYKRMLRAKRKMLASGNIDVESFKRMYPSYSNFEIVYSETENNKQNVNINGPPTLNGIADDRALLYGTEADSKIGDSPPKGRAPNGRDGPPGDDGASPPRGSSPPNGESPFKDTGPPNNKGDSGGRSPAEDAAQTDMTHKKSVTEATEMKPKIDKSVYAVSTGGLYDSQDKTQQDKELHELQDLADKKNLKKTKTKLAKGEVILTHDELVSMTDIYSWTNADFIANTALTNKGVVVKPNKKNQIYLVSKKTRRQFSLAGLGIVYSVNTGIITTSSGMYKYILSTSGVEFEQIKVNPKYTIISAKQDIFGNVFVGITGGTNQEETYETSDGKLVSIWNRNALLTIGDDHRLYYISMDKSYNLDKGVITDLKVMSKEGKLHSVNQDKISKTIKFVDGFEKYGFMYLTPTVLCLDKGRLFFVLKSATTLRLSNSQWLTADGTIVEHDKKNKRLIKFDLDDFLSRNLEAAEVDDDTGGNVIAENVSKLTVQEKLIEFEAGNGKQTIDLYS